jgi:hypothetical protein
VFSVATFEELIRQMRRTIVEHQDSWTRVLESFSPSWKFGNESLLKAEIENRSADGSMRDFCQNSIAVNRFSGDDHG